MRFIFSNMDNRLSKVATKDRIVANCSSAASTKFNGAYDAYSIEGLLVHIVLVDILPVASQFINDTSLTKYSSIQDPIENLVKARRPV